MGEPPGRVRNYRAVMNLTSNPFNSVGLALAVALVTGASAFAAEPAQPPVEAPKGAPVFTFYLENDYFGGSDRHYTNGVKLSWLSGNLNALPKRARDFADELPLVGRDAKRRNFGIALGQNIYTPEDTDAVVPNPADRPYAGWTYLEFSLVSRTERVMNTLSLQIGVVGRHSYAEEAQNEFHRLIRNNEARGWAYQLEDEVAGSVILERRWRLLARSFSETVGVDFVPHAGVSLGTVKTHAKVGATARLGFNLPNDFGVELISGGAATNSPLDARDPRLDGNRRMSFFIFGGCDARAVARDLFLDGNTFEDSPSVDKENFVSDAYYGIGVVLKKWQLTYTDVVRSKEFKGQRKKNYFGSITLSRAF